MYFLKTRFVEILKNKQCEIYLKEKLIEYCSLFEFGESEETQQPQVRIQSVVTSHVWSSIEAFP